MRRYLVALITVVAAAPLAAQQPFMQGFTDAFTPAEFAARRTKVMEKIGDGIAVIQGSAEYPAYLAFRQNAQFFYLSGVEAPRAVLVIDGKRHTSTLILPATYRLANSEGPMLVAGDDARRITGIEQVQPKDSVIPLLTRLAAEGRQFYAPFRLESRNAGAKEQSSGFDRANATDPLDGRPSREKVLVDKLNSLSGKPTLDLDPILDGLRMIKSPAEIAVMREAARIAQMGIMEAMRSAHPGMYEYQIAAVADYEFRNANAQGPAYFALASTGTNAAWPHYHGTASKLGPNDMVLLDYAPDYKYYQSDVTREFPSNGKFTPRQREMYTIYLRLFQAVEQSMKTGVAPRDISKAAAEKMDTIMAHFTFTDPKIKDAAKRMVDSYRTPRGNSLGHMVGMETHDASLPYEVLLPGMVFTIEPAMTIPDERVYIRLESVFLVTEKGVENISTMAPVEPDAIEKLMKEIGIGKKR